MLIDLGVLDCRMIGVEGLAHIFLLIRPTAVLGGGSFGGQSDIELLLIETVLLEILK